MFNALKIQNALYGVVGVRQPLNGDYAILDANNTSSRSNLYADSNSAIKVESLYDNQDFKGLTDAEFNTNVANLQKDAIVSVANNVFDKPDYIDRQVLFTGIQNKVNTEVLPAGLVAFKVEVAPQKNVAFEIKRVLLDFQGTGGFKLMLFNTSKSEPILTEDITISSSHESVELNWKVDNSGDTYKGDYYLGYLSSDLGSLEPFKRDFSDSNIMSSVTYLEINKVLFSNHSTETLPDLRLESGLSECIGINPDITVYEDYTDLIIQNESILARAILLEFQIKWIEVYMTSIRSNSTERQAYQNYLKIIAGDNTFQSVEGLRPELNRELRQVKKEIKKLQEGYFGGRIMVDTLM